MERERLDYAGFRTGDDGSGAIAGRSDLTGLSAGGFVL